MFSDHVVIDSQKDIISHEIGPYSFTLFKEGEFVGNSFLADYRVWTAQHVADEFVVEDLFQNTEMRDVAMSKIEHQSRGIPIAKELKNGEILTTYSKSADGVVTIGRAKATIINKDRIRLRGVLMDPGQSGSVVINDKMEAVGVWNESIGALDNSLFTPFSGIKLIRSRK